MPRPSVSSVSAQGGRFGIFKTREKPPGFLAADSFRALPHAAPDSSWCSFVTTSQDASYRAVTRISLEECSGFRNTFAEQFVGTAGSWRSGVMFQPIARAVF